MFIRNVYFLLLLRLINGTAQISFQSLDCIDGAHFVSKKKYKSKNLDHLSCRQDENIFIAWKTRSNLFIFGHSKIRTIRPRTTKKTRNKQETNNNKTNEARKCNLTSEIPRIGSISAETTFFQKLFFPWNSKQHFKLFYADRQKETLISAEMVPITLIYTSAF